ncbi:hypothetical protein ACFL54_08435, partial [Planctomycetota bacterium]
MTVVLALFDFYFAAINSVMPPLQSLRLFVILGASIGAFLLTCCLVDSLLHAWIIKAATGDKKYLVAALVPAILFSLFFLMYASRDLLTPPRIIYKALLAAHFGYCLLLAAWLLLRLKHISAEMWQSNFSLISLFVFPLWDMAGILCHNSRRRNLIALAVVALMLCGILILNYHYLLLNITARTFIPMHDYMSVDILIMSLILVQLSTLTRPVAKPGQWRVAVILPCALILIILSVVLPDSELKNELERRELSRVAHSFFKQFSPHTTNIWSQAGKPAPAPDEDIFLPRDMFVLAGEGQQQKLRRAHVFF